MRQWKKDVKARHSTFLVDKGKLAKFLNNRQEEIDEEMERKRFEAKQEQQQEEVSRLTELHLRQEEHERDRRKLMHNYRRRITAETGKRSPLNHSKTGQIDNNTVQKNAHRLG